MELTKQNEDALKAINIIVSNNDKEGFYGDGNSIVETPELPIKHDFADQIYLRQMTMKKGQIVVGAIHNHLHIWFLLTGKVHIIEHGETIEHIAPCYTVSAPGAQRVIYAVEDSIFVNIHKNPTNTKDIKELENEIVSITLEEFNKKQSKK